MKNVLLKVALPLVAAVATVAVVVKVFRAPR